MSINLLALTQRLCKCRNKVITSEDRGGEVDISKLSREQLLEALTTLNNEYMALRQNIQVAIPISNQHVDMSLEDRAAEYNGIQRTLPLRRDHPVNSSLDCGGAERRVHEGRQAFRALRALQAGD